MNSQDFLVVLYLEVNSLIPKNALNENFAIYPKYAWLCSVNSYTSSITYNHTYIHVYMHSMSIYADWTTNGNDNWRTNSTQPQSPSWSTEPCYKTYYPCMSVSHSWKLLSSLLHTFLFECNLTCPALHNKIVFFERFWYFPWLRPYQKIGRNPIVQNAAKLQVVDIDSLKKSI